MLNKRILRYAMILFIITGSLIFCQTRAIAAGWQSNGQSENTTWSYIDAYGNRTTGW